MSDAALKEQFLKYCNQGVGSKDKDKAKTTLTNMNITKMFKDLELFKKTLTSNALDILFSKIKANRKNEITFDEFKRLLEDEAITDVYKDTEAVKEKIAKGKGPSTKGTTTTSKTGNVAGMTDTSQYTGAHRERFGEDGKGKGLDGRTDKVDGSGYVANYKGAGTFDQKK